MDMSNKPKKKSNHGGPRPNSGRPRGSMLPQTLLKMKVKEQMNQRILRMTNSLLNSQLLIATGQTFLYKIEKKEVIGPKGGVSYQNLPPKLVTSQYEIEEYLTGMSQGNIGDDKDPKATYYYLTTKEPNNEALKDLFNRVHGKPKETIEGTLDVRFSLRDLAARREQLNLPNQIVQNVLEESKKETSRE